MTISSSDFFTPRDRHFKRGCPRRARYAKRLYLVAIITLLFVQLVVDLCLIAGVRRKKLLHFHRNVE